MDSPTYALIIWVREGLVPLKQYLITLHRGKASASDLSVLRRRRQRAFCASSEGIAEEK